MKIEKLKNKDVSGVVRIHRDCISKTNSLVYPSDVITKWVSQVTEHKVQNQLDDSNWHVIKEGGIIVGFCQYDLNSGELCQIQVSPEYQGKGYGRSLYDFIEDNFKTCKETKIVLNSTLNAVLFYEKMGFKQINNIAFPLDHSITINMIKMEKQLPKDFSAI
ncbi:MAG: GNAT family N-acetyltransferase [bacterium]